MNVTYKNQPEDTVSLQTVGIGMVGSTITSVIRVQHVAAEETEDGEDDINIEIHTPLDPEETIQLLETLADGIKRAIEAQS